MAYADYNDLMSLTETMLSELVKSVTGSFKIQFHPNGRDSDEVVEIDFTPPFKRVSMMSTLEEKMNVKFPQNLEG